MLNAQPTQTVPAVPIAMKKAQQNVAGSMGSNPGAPGPLANPPKEASKLKKPKKKLHIKYIVGRTFISSSSDWWWSWFLPYSG